eukprot:GDKH01024904.1.p3 GENE.GDKH01024904.1~~GDKH01024904.1.p3  ORF type:complete len:58 (-),score=11.83 GDKH01024904.1:158-307(-)
MDKSVALHNKKLAAGLLAGVLDLLRAVFWDALECSADAVPSHQLYVWPL